MGQCYFNNCKTLVGMFCQGVMQLHPMHAESRTVVASTGFAVNFTLVVLLYFIASMSRVAWGSRLPADRKPFCLVNVSMHINTAQTCNKGQVFPRVRKLAHLHIHAKCQTVFWCGDKSVVSISFVQGTSYPIHSFAWLPDIYNLATLHANAVQWAYMLQQRLSCLRYACWQIYNICQNCYEFANIVAHVGNLGITIDVPYQ